MPEPREVHRRTSLLLAAAMVTVGIALIATTLSRGGGPLAIGVVLGALFCLVGAGRLYLGTRR
jgi:hypothetical protein